MIENLYRSRTDKWLGGVAAGLAERFGWPTLVVRLLFVLVAVFFLSVNPVIVPVVYLVMWLVTPQAPAEEPIEEEVKVVVEEVGSEGEDG